MKPSEYHDPLHGEDAVASWLVSTTGQRNVYPIVFANKSERTGILELVIVTHVNELPDKWSMAVLQHTSQRITRYDSNGLCLYRLRIDPARFDLFDSEFLLMTDKEYEHHMWMLEARTPSWLRLLGGKHGKETQQAG